MKLLELTLKSMRNRSATTLLTISVIAISVVLLLGVQKIRHEAKASFANTISGTDLIVGARSGGLQLLLYSVFRIGNATNNITWQSYQEIAADPNIAWTVPISLGDSHQGFRVVGTSTDYFEHYKYGRKQALEIAKGKVFSAVYDAVLGADVARELGYDLGVEIALTHGTGEHNLFDHADKPFTVVGILKKTGTPIDRSIHVSLEAIEAIHIDWSAGVPIASQAVTAEETLGMDLTPNAITAFLVGLKNKRVIFRLQNAINTYNREPLLAILPGVTLKELWDLMSVAERALLLISGFVVLSGLIGMLSSILSSLRERRREMAILRSVGAKPRDVFFLLIAESTIATLLGVVAGVVLLYGLLFALRPWIQSNYGLFISITPPSQEDWLLLALVVGVGVVMGIVPAARAYRNSLIDGMTIKL